MIEILGIELGQQSVVLGLITGLTYAALAAGFVLVYRSTGVLNFAHGEMGIFGLALFVMMIVNFDVNWWVAFALAILASALIGMVVELIVVRRLFESPRLVLLIATVGVGQILTLARTSWIPDITSGGNIPTAFEVTWEPTDHIRLQARELTVVLVVPALIALLGLFMTRTRFGLAVRASASNADTARVYGTSPRRVSTIVWTIAGAFAAATAILTAPLQGIQAATVDDGGNLLVEELLLKVLVVSLLARMRSLPGVIWAGLAVGVVEKIVRANVESSNQSFVNVWFFVTVLIVVLWFVRSGRHEASWSLSPTMRAVPERLRGLWWVHNLNAMGFVLLFGLLAAIPLVVTTSAGILIWTNILILSMVALSLSVLTGWAGQLSLGQFAFVGLGGLSTLAFTAGHDIPVPFNLFDASIDVPWGIAVLLATTLGVLAALLIGLPALRVRGLFLAVTTLAFAVAAGTWLFPQDFFTGGTTVPRPPRPPSFLGVDFGESRRSLYLLCLGTLMCASWIVARIRATGVGRTLIAVRDNEEMAAASTVSPARAKLSAFAVAGGISALAGSLFVIVQPSLSPGTQFAPSESIRVVVIAIIGGLGSVAGPVLGALWILGIREITPDGLRDLQQLLTSNIGLLVLLMYFPGGLLQLVYNARDGLLSYADKRYEVDDAKAAAPAVDRVVPTRPRESDFSPPDGPALAVHGVTVRFGGNVAVSDVDFHIDQGELVGLIGTNGAGKSTLLNAVSGFVPSTGTIEVFGEDISSRSAPARARAGLGRGFQAARLYPDLTVREALMVALEARQHSLLVPSMLGLPPSPQHERAKRAEADEIIDYLGLGRYADQLIAALSTGTRRIVELGSLLAVDARVLLLDEPTGGVAQRETEAFGPLIKRIQEELSASVVVIEHDMPLVLSISDRVYCLESGSVIAEGTPDEIRNDPLVIASYLGTDERAIRRSGTAAPD